MCPASSPSKTLWRKVVKLCNLQAVPDAVCNSPLQRYACSEAPLPKLLSCHAGCAKPTAPSYYCGSPHRHIWHNGANSDQGARAACPNHHDCAHNCWRAPLQAPQLCVRAQLPLFRSIQADIQQLCLRALCASPAAWHAHRVHAAAVMAATLSEHCVDISRSAADQLSVCYSATEH